jgi:hypothetical protein
VARAVLVCVVLLVLASTPGLALAAKHHQAAPRVSGQQALRVTVRPVTRLYPGAHPGLTATFRNTAKFDVLLTTATSATFGVHGCPATAFVLSTYRFHPAVRLRPGRTVTRRLPFAMRATAPAACQRRTVTVRVTGRVTRP